MQESKKLVFWGASGQARVLRECAEDERYSLVALFDNRPDVISPFEGVPVYCGWQGFLDWHAGQEDPGAVNYCIAIGGGPGVERDKIFRALAEKGLRPAGMVHPTAFVAERENLGKGCQILAQSAVCTEARLGDNCIVNTGATVDHECLLGDSVHVCPGAHVTGEVKIGSYSLIGAGSVILPRLEIGENVIIGAGSVVTRDVPPNTVVVGNPAREQGRS